MPKVYRRNCSLGATSVACCGLLSFAVLMTGCGVQPSQPQPKTQSHQLTALLVTPASVSLPLGENLQLNAIGILADGSRQDLTPTVKWNSASVSIARVNMTGLVTGLSSGTVKISATDGDIAGSQVVYVTPAALMTISISPAAAAAALGDNAQFKATGNFSDGSKQDLTTSAAWSIAQPAVASIDRNGTARGLATGNSQITASMAGLSGSAILTVSQAALTAITITNPNAPVPIGNAVQLSASGKFSDGSVQDVTSLVSWSSTPPGIFAITRAGLATSQSQGTATVTALSGSLVSSANLTAVPAALVSINLVDAPPTLPLGATHHLTAMGTYTDTSRVDITTRVAWQTSSSEVIAVDAMGVATGKAIGQATVTAAAEALSASSDLSVTQATLTSVNIAPRQSQIPLGATQAFQLIGTYTDGTTSVLTDPVGWSSSTAAVASIDGAGSATAAGLGVTTISASYQGLTDSTSLSVEPVLKIDYFANPSVAEGAIRLSNSGLTGGNLCAMIYVFDQHQQLSECCGCIVSPNGLRSLSLQKDLTSNPLTGVVPNAGTVEVLSSDYASNPSCDASAPTPSGLISGWGSHLTKVSSQSYVTTETPLQTTVLGDNELQSLGSQCWFVHTNGSNHGICTCGTGD